MKIIIGLSFSLMSIFCAIELFANENTSKSTIEERAAWDVENSTGITRAVFAMAGIIKKIKTNEQMQYDVIAASPEEVNILRQLANVSDPDIRFGALMLLMERPDCRENAFSLSENDPSYKVQVLPLLWLAARDNKTEKSREFKKAQALLMKNFTERLATDAIQELSRGNWRFNFKNSGEKNFNSFYAQSYLMAVKEKPKPHVKKYLEANPDKPMWHFYSELSENDRRDPHGIKLIIKVLNATLLEEGTTAEKCDRARKFAGPASVVREMSEWKPGLFDSNTIAQIGSLVSARPENSKGCMTSHNAYGYLWDAHANLTGPTR